MHDFKKTGLGLSVFAFFLIQSGCQLSSTNATSGDAASESVASSSIPPAPPVPPLPQDDDSGCGSATLQLTWPVSGTDSNDWVITRYVDVDHTSGSMMDYSGNTGSDAKTIDGHPGIDISIASFRQMDAGMPVLAATDGTVVAIQQGNFDRSLGNTAGCGAPNYVQLQHDKGFSTFYYNLKKNSVVVKIGDVVSAGQVIAAVGSSGCATTHPHLHFEVRDCNNAVVDPFQVGMWSQAPIYDTQLGIMDLFIKKGTFTADSQLVTAAPNIAVAAPGDQIGFGMVTAGGNGNPEDLLDVYVLRPDKSIYAEWTSTINSPTSLKYWRWSASPDNAPGTWEFRAYVNGQIAKSAFFNVSKYAYDANFQKVRSGMSLANYQDEFNQLSAGGYHPKWLDAYDINGVPYINMVWDRSPVGAWLSFNDMNASDLQSKFDQLVQDGYRPTLIDNYRSGNTVKYLAIFEQKPGSGWRAKSDQTPAQFQATFNTLAAQGYHPVNISYVQVNGKTTVSSLFEQGDVGAWVAAPGLTASGLQSQFNQISSTEELIYLNGYMEDGVPKFSTIWASKPLDGWILSSALSSAGFQSTFNSMAGQGFATRLVAGFDNGSGIPNFMGLWVK